MESDRVSVLQDRVLHLELLTNEIKQTCDDAIRLNAILMEKFDELEREHIALDKLVRPLG